MQACELKAKGGARIVLADAQGSSHTVAEKALHIVLPPPKTKATEPAEILAEYEAEMAKDPTEFVDPELLELAWSVCAESEKPSFTPKSIISEIDESLCKSQVDLYRAFRVMSSDLGKVFFKSLSANRFKPKAGKAVKASKENWCREPEHEHEWCFV